MAEKTKKQVVVQKLNPLQQNPFHHQHIQIQFHHPLVYLNKMI